MNNESINIKNNIYPFFQVWLKNSSIFLHQHVEMRNCRQILFFPLIYFFFQFLWRYNMQKHEVKQAKVAVYFSNLDLFNKTLHLQLYQFLRPYFFSSSYEQNSVGRWMKLDLEWKENFIIFQYILTKYLRNHTSSGAPT